MLCAGSKRDSNQYVGRRAGGYLMPSQVLRVGYRPLRIGFLIRAGNTEDLLIAVRLNTLLWGGIHNPLIPTGEERNVVDDLITAFKVDVLHPVADSEELHDVMRAYKHLSWPHSLRNKSGLLMEADRAQELQAVDVLHWIVRSRPEEGGSPYCFVRWNTSDSLATLFACMFGQFPSREHLNLAYDYERNFIEGLRAQDVPILSDQSVHDFLLHHIAPIAFTATSLEPEGFIFRRDRGVYIGEPSFRHLVNYWNVRASGASCVFYPLGHEARLTSYVHEYLQRLVEWASRQAETSGFISVWRANEQSIPPEVSREIPADLRLLTIPVIDMMEHLNSLGDMCSGTMLDSFCSLEETISGASIATI